MDLVSLQLLLWALPVFLSIHVVEEFGYPGGFIQWMAAHNPRRIKSTWYYIAINSAGIVVGILIALTAKDAVGYCIFVFTVTFMATNGLSHLIAAIQEKRYCPGCVTGPLLFMPLAVVSYWKFLTDNLMNWQSLVINAFLGFIVGFVVLTVHQRGESPGN